ncbi:MAG: hypothetical protein J2P37_19950, partial [Ktedonobacteraceae bacterium]|nr:hypothetical protein [Ktedonobacteraceae bacterium]
FTSRRQTRAAIALFVIGAIHWIDILLIALHRQEAAGSAFAQSQLNSSSIVHLIMGGLFLVAAFLVRKGRNWVRIAIVVLLIFQLIGHLTLPLVVSILPTEAWSIVAVQVFSLLFELAVVFLLWFARPSRAFFTLGRRQRS